MNEAFEVSAQRVRELLEAHMRDARRVVTEEVAGKVSVTVDARLQVTAVRILDDSINERTRQELEKAVIEAVNGAQRRAVLASAEAVSRLYEFSDWKVATEGLFNMKKSSNSD